MSPFPPLLRRCLGAIFLLVALCLLLGAVSIPFIHESWTIKYKFGLDRVLLRTGQVLGAAAGFFMMFQFVLSGRLKLLDRIFAVNRLSRCHRIFGIGIAVLALLHAPLVLLSEGPAIIAPAVKNWPQYAGLLLLIMICSLVFASRWRNLIRLPYDIWRFFHTKATHLAVTVLAVHVLFACDTFEYPPPRTWLLIALGIYGLLLVRIRTGRFFSRRLEVVDVTPIGREAHAVRLRTADGRKFAFLPGQFVFIRFKSDSISPEPHPFTLSSPPSSTAEVELTIRSCGDWTEKVRRLEPGDGARIEGPYGLFGHTDLTHAPGTVMIAGGIGITPMLSILGSLAEKDWQRPILLLWSNRTRGHVAHPERLAAYQRRLKNLRVVHIFTRDPGPSVKSHRLDPPGLGTILAEADRRSKVLVSGPPAMMTWVRKTLLSLGFSRRDIIMERFDL